MFNVRQINSSDQFRPYRVLLIHGGRDILTSDTPRTETLGLPLIVRSESHGHQLPLRKST